MKIVVLNGSPRLNGNTAKHVEAFKAGAEAAGNEVVVLTVGKMNVNGCLGCEYCHGKGEGKCIQGCLVCILSGGQVSIPPALFGSFLYSPTLNHAFLLSEVPDFHMLLAFPLAGGSASEGMFHVIDRYSIFYRQIH